jgi:hypothetical protein
MAADPFRTPRTFPPKPEVASAGQLWRHVPIGQRLDAARAFWSDRNAATQHAEAVAEMARLLRFRPKSMHALPVEKKVHHLASLARLSDSVAGQVLVIYHLATKRPMMRAFLDALGIAHEDGVIAAPAELKAPDPKRLEAAVKGLRDAFLAEDVHLYLSTLLVQDAMVWGGLAALLPGGGAMGASGS